jgi:hypothetical protein
MSRSAAPMMDEAVVKRRGKVATVREQFNREMARNDILAAADEP